MVRELDVKLVGVAVHCFTKCHHPMAQYNPEYRLVARIGRSRRLIEAPLNVDEDTPQVEFDRIIEDALRILQATARLMGNAEPEPDDKYTERIGSKLRLLSQFPATYMRIKGL